MGTKVSNITRLLGLSLIVFLIGSSNTQAQESIHKEYTPKDLFGLNVSLAPMGMGVLLSPALGATSDQFTYPQVGGRIQLGWLLHKKSLALPTLVASYTYAINQDKETVGQFKSIAVLDLGAEISPWILYSTKDKKHAVSIRIGTYVSMCSTKFGEDKTMRHRWGVSRRIALGYTYQLKGDMRLGVNLYNHTGHYFGKRPQQGFPVPVYTEELGISFDIYL